MPLNEFYCHHSWGGFQRSYLQWRDLRPAGCRASQISGPAASHETGLASGANGNGPKSPRGSRLEDRTRRGDLENTAELSRIYSAIARRAWHSKARLRENAQWLVSDRSVCYLASGRPVVMEDTGLAGTIPIGDGML